jgi:hypothetical protein
MDENIRKKIGPIYEQMGAIVQSSQQMEFSIGFALTLLKQLAQGSLPDEVFDDSMDKFSKQTLGRLIGAIKKHFSFNKGAEDTLALALNERNYMIHSFFHDQTEFFASPEGRKELLDRVQKARTNIDPGFRILDSIVSALMEANGMSMAKVMEDVKSTIK